VEQLNKIIFFDGICNLCNATVQFVIKRDKKAIFKFAPLQSGTGHAALRKMRMKPDHLETIIYLRGDRYLTKSSAILYVLKDIGGIWQLVFGFMIIPAFIRDFVYGIVARNRYRIFGKKESCMIPAPELKSRFLD